MARGGSDGGGSPNQALIIFLVFFVLATIALGVTTYLGYSDQAKLIADKDAAKKDADKKNSNSDWFQFQALFYRQLMGEKLNDEDKKAYAVLRDRFASGELERGTTDTRKEDALKTLRAQVDNPELFEQARDPNRQPKPDPNEEAKELAKDKIKKDPIKSYPEVVQARQKKVDEITNVTLAAAKKELKDAQDKINELTTTLAAEKKAFADGLAKANAAAAANLQKNIDERAELQKRLDAVGAELAKLNEDTGTLKDEQAKKVTTLTKEIKLLNEVVGKLKAQVEQPVSIFDYDTPKGRISSIDSTGDMPFINIGSADGLKPGVTFSVYGVGLDGKPIAYDVLNREGKPVVGADGKHEKEGKATVEVLAVVGPHQSQVRVTSVRDRNQDPIMKGDLLFNPSWNPAIQQHVAIAGQVDLSGSGRDELSEFLRTLEKNRVVVDAYQDLREVTVKGQVTRQTDYLILGDVPNFEGSDRAKEDDPRMKRRDEIIAQMTKMQEDAQRNGVTVISLRKFLLLSGYKVPRAAISNDGVSGYRPGLGGK